MSRRRAILTDIHDFGLDPNVPHKTRASGRLAKQHVIENAVGEQVSVEIIKDETNKLDSVTTDESGNSDLTDTTTKPVPKRHVRKTKKKEDPKKSSS